MLLSTTLYRAVKAHEIICTSPRRPALFVAFTPGLGSATGAPSCRGFQQSRVSDAPMTPAPWIALRALEPPVGASGCNKPRASVGAAGAPSCRGFQQSRVSDAPMTPAPLILLLLLSLLSFCISCRKPFFKEPKNRSYNRASAPH